MGILANIGDSESLPKTNSCDSENESNKEKKMMGVRNNIEKISQKYHFKRQNCCYNRVIVGVTYFKMYRNADTYI